jgi:hypothetical protein
MATNWYWLVQSYTTNAQNKNRAGPWSGERMRSVHYFWDNPRSILWSKNASFIHVVYYNFYCYFSYVW